MRLATELSLPGRVRYDILTAANKAGRKGAHIASSLSLVEICLGIICQFESEHDYLVLSKGHGALGYYASMHQIGMITDEQFDTFEVNGGEFPGQPSRSTTNKVCFSSGSLGMGLPYALGVAMGKKKNNKAGTVYVIIGDGELNEGSNWEAAALAARYSLDNLVAVIDMNGLQSDGRCDDIMGQRTEALWAAHGWQVYTCDGHTLEGIRTVVHKEHDNMPLVILAKTVKGKGVSFMENNNEWHHAVLKNEEFEQAMEEVSQKYGIL